MGFTYENAAEAALVAAGDVSLAADTLTTGALSGLDSEMLVCKCTSDAIVLLCVAVLWVGRHATPLATHCV